MVNSSLLLMRLRYYSFQESALVQKKREKRNEKTVEAVTRSFASGLFRVWIEAIVDYQWSHKILLSLLPLTLPWLVLSPGLMLLYRKLLYAPPTCEGIAHKIYLILVLSSKDLGNARWKKDPSTKMQHYENNRNWAIWNVRSSLIHVKLYIKFLVFYFFTIKSTIW